MEFVQADLCAFLEILENLDEKKSASWGKMTPQRMIEHLNDCIYMSCGIGNHELLIPEEKINHPAFKNYSQALAKVLMYNPKSTDTTNVVHVNFGQD